MIAQDASLRTMYAGTGTLPLVAGDAPVSHRPLGTLRVRAPRVLVADPLEPGCERRPVDERVEPGDYLAVAVLAQTRAGERVAGVLLRLRSSEPLRWESSPTVGFDPVTVGILATPSFTVESGYACVGDEAAVSRWLDRLEGERGESAAHVLRAELLRGDAGGWAHAELKNAGDEGAGNVLVISAGMGRGMYWSFSGYDAGGALACLITDFRLEDYVEPTRRGSEPAGSRTQPRPWWKKFFR